MPSRTTAHALCVVLTTFASTPIFAADAPAPRLSWKNNILTLAAPDLPGRELKILYIEAYCRPGSTDRDWKQTTIGHTTKLLSAADDGHALTLECTLRDGVVVRHDITAAADELDFRITATNPTDKPSQAHWAQPCVRVDAFTGRDQKTYLENASSSSTANSRACPPATGPPKPATPPAKSGARPTSTATTSTPAP